MGRLDAGKPHRNWADLPDPGVTHAAGLGCSLLMVCLKEDCHPCLSAFPGLCRGTGGQKDSLMSRIVKRYPTRSPPCLLYPVSNSALKEQGSCRRGRTRLPTLAECPVLIQKLKGQRSKLPAGERGRARYEEAGGASTSGQASFEAKDLESLSGSYHTVCCIDVLIHYPPVRLALFILGCVFC